MRVLASLLLTLTSASAQTCDSSTFSAVAGVVSDLCCENGGACTGVPAACNTDCAPTFLWLYQHCYDQISSLPAAQLAAYQSLASKCRASEVRARGRGT